MRADFIGFYERAGPPSGISLCIVVFLWQGGGGWFTFTSDWLAGLFASVLIGLMCKLGFLP